MITLGLETVIGLLAIGVADYWKCKGDSQTGVWRIWYYALGTGWMVVSTLLIFRLVQLRF